MPSSARLMGVMGLIFSSGTKRAYLSAQYTSLASFMRFSAKGAISSSDPGPMLTI